MKAVFTLLFLFVIIEISIAQSGENYRSRNHKLNRNYLKDINSEKHRVSFYKASESKVAKRKLKSTHQVVKSSGSKKVAMKADRILKRETEKKESRNQKSTLRGTNKKSGKQLASYFTMILAFSLILVNK